MLGTVVEDVCDFLCVAWADDADGRAAFSVAEGGDCAMNSLAFANQVFCTYYVCQCVEVAGDFFGSGEALRVVEACVYSVSKLVCSLC